MGKKRKTSVRCKTSKNQNKHAKEYQIQKQKRKNVCGDKDVISEYRVPLNQIFDKNGLSSDSIYDELLNKSSDNSSVYSGNTSIMSAINLQKKEIARSILFGNKSKDVNKSCSTVSPYLKGHNKMEQFKSKLKQIEMREEKEKQNNNNNNKSNNSKSRFMLAKIRSNSLKSNIMSDEETIIMKRNSRSNSNVSGDTLMTSQTRSTIATRIETRIENNNNNGDSANINKCNINEKKKKKRKRAKNEKNENTNENENIIVINNLDDQVTSKILLKIIRKLILSRKETTNDTNSILLNQDCVSLDMIHIGYKNGSKYGTIDLTTHDLNQNDSAAHQNANFVKQLLTGKKLFGKLLCVSTAAIEDVTDIDEDC